MRWLVDLVYVVAGLLYLPIALYHAFVVGKNRRGWGQRLGFVPAFEPGRRRIWVHAVSLGEINATPRLVEELQERLPEIEIVFSTTTDTGFTRAVQLYGPERVFRFPLDFSLVIARVLRRVRPTLIVLVELEVWHNLVRMATRQGIPVAVVNGRLTTHSARRLRCLGRPVRSMFGDLAWVGAQDEPIASRFRALGVADNRIEITSSMKWDSASVTDHVEGADALGRAVGIDRSRPLWVCGSTGPGEEVMILNAYRRLLRDWPAPAGGMAKRQRGHALRQPRGLMPAPSAWAWHPSGALPILAIVPRKPERFSEAARIIERAGFACIRRSDHRNAAPTVPVGEETVILGDTMGELRKFYSLADVVFVGRTLVPMGGSDPMEVAAMGKPLVVGPHVDNFQLPVEALRAADAIRTVDSDDGLAPIIAAILRDKRLAQALGRRARQVVIDRQGATGRTADAIVRILSAV
jgi:3-deoxy-D-manno-octulosonic-acid transferase